MKERISFYQYLYCTVEGVVNRSAPTDLQKKQDNFTQSKAIIQIREEYTVQIDRGHISEGIQMTQVPLRVTLNNSKGRGSYCGHTLSRFVH